MRLKPFAFYYAIRSTVAVFLFPGVIVHEAAHVVFCKMLGVKVQEVRYFKIGRSLGYVYRDASASALQEVLIGISPLLVNPLIGFTLGALLLNHIWRHLLQGPLYVLYCWLGISIAALGTPSFTDVQIARQFSWTTTSLAAKCLSFCLTSLALFGAAAGLFLLDIACGVVVFFAPSLIWK